MLLIVLETGRRFGHLEQWVSLIDDYLGGSFLVFAGIKFRVSPARYIRLLAIAWAVLIGGFSYSIIGSIAAVQASAVENTGQSSVLVLLVKIMLLLVVLLNLIWCMRWKPEGP